MEQWITLDDVGFPDYEVSNYGEIRRNNYYGSQGPRILIPSRNQSGAYKIGMMHPHSSKQVTRSLALLVAQAFLPYPPNERYNTPINLDGDRSNNRADNLAWRPRWFAVKYHQQFYNNQRGFVVPVVEIYTGEEFNTSWDAAIKYGLIDRDILMANMNHQDVFPTGQKFEVIEYY